MDNNNMTDTLKQAVVLVKQLSHTEMRALYEALQNTLFIMEIENKKAVQAMLD
jgi:hypothetical protein